MDSLSAAEGATTELRGLKGSLKVKRDWVAGGVAVMRELDELLVVVLSDMIGTWSVLQTSARSSP
jgi:hypothetical protein